MDDLIPVDQPVIDPNKDYLVELVGEGKKYKTEADLAKALVHSQAHIQRLEAEAAERREVGETRERVAAFEARMAALETARKTEDNPPRVGDPDPKPPSETPEQLEARLLKLIDQRDAKAVRDRNLISVREKLVETLGENYAHRVHQRAAELGMDVKELNELAATKPQAFLALVTPTTNSRPVDVAPPPSTRSGFVPQTGGKRNYAYYQAMRKSNPAQYASQSVQNQEMKDALEQGEDFYK